MDLTSVNAGPTERTCATYLKSTNTESC